MQKTILTSVIAGVLALPLQAGTMREESKLVINRINATDFEVLEPNESTPRGFWCGAANYIEARTNQSELTPIYLKSPRGPSVTAPGRIGVVFSTSNAGLPPVGQQLSVNVTTPGRMLKSYQARGFCRDAFTRATK